MTFILLTVLALSDPEPVKHDINGIIERCTKSYRAIKSIQVEYHVVGRRIFDIPSAGTNQAVELDYSAHFIDFGDDRQFFGIDMKKHRRQVVNSAFDGEKTYMQYVDGGSTMIHKGRYTRAFDDYEVYCQTFLGLPTSDWAKANQSTSWSFPGCLVPRKDKYQLRPHLEQVDGRWCHVLEYPGFDICWIDMDRGGVLLRRERKNPSDKGSIPLSTFIFQDFTKVGQDIWLPKECVDKSYPPPNNPAEILAKPYYQTTVSVKSVSINNPDTSKLQLTLTPGTSIYDAISQQRYRVEGSNVKGLDRIASEMQQAVSVSSKYQWMLWVLLFGVLIAVLSITTHRYLRKRPKLQTSDSAT